VVAHDLAVLQQSNQVALHLVEEILTFCIKEAKKAARFAPSLPEKLRLQREVKRLESRQDEAWRAFDQASRELGRDKEKLLETSSGG
jgi:hypothetical protein